MLYQLKQTIQSKHNNEKFSQRVQVERIEKGNRTYLKYDETMQDENVSVVLSIEENVVRIMRKGPMTMNFKFVEGVKTGTVYETVAGRHRFNIYTTDIQLKDEEIYILYKLYEADELLGSYEYHLKKEE